MQRLRKSMAISLDVRCFRSFKQNKENFTLFITQITVGEKHDSF